MGKKFVTDNEIKKIHKHVKDGKNIGNVVKEFGISRQAYHQRIEKLGIEAKPKKRVDRLKAVDVENLETISDMYDLAALLNLDFEGVHGVLKSAKGIEANIKRISHLKNNSPAKFQEAILIIILKHFNVGPIELVKILKKTKSKTYEV